MSTGTSARRPEDEDLQFMPVFCTANIPKEVLETFLQVATNGREEGENYRPALLTTTDISTITTPSTTAPPSQSINPFLGWTVEECYQFFTLNISDPNNEVAGPWTAHTFVVLDSRTAEDGKTCFLCSDVPDYHERHRVVLKSVRSVFKEVLIEGMCYETFVRRPSESGAGALGAGDVMTGDENYMGLSVMPPLAYASMAGRRAAISYGIDNSSIEEGRRFWERYFEENEREDRVTGKVQDAEDEMEQT